MFHFDSGKVFLNIDIYNSYAVTVGGKNYNIGPRSGLIVPS
jgi:hypothetical protein